MSLERGAPFFSARFARSRPKLVRPSPHAKSAAHRRVQWWAGSTCGRLWGRATRPALPKTCDSKGATKNDWLATRPFRDAAEWTTLSGAFTTPQMILFLALVAAVSGDTVSYANDASWLCRPGRKDACAIDLTTSVIAPDGRLTKEEFTARGDAPIDCFYVYPTVSRDTSYYSDMVAGDEERNVVRQQFARFSSVCRPYAPLYRQITITGLGVFLSGKAPPGSTLSSGTGYDDVLAAWRYYLAHDNKGRGVVLIGHSQGAMVLEQLIRAQIDGKGDQARVVSAILLGSTLLVPKGRDVGGAFKSIPLCRFASQAGCAVAFGSFRRTMPPSARAYFGRSQNDSLEAACTNPAALGGGESELRSYLTGKGALIAQSEAPPHKWVRSGPPIETPFVRVPGLLTGECVSDANGSRLVVTVHADSSDARADDIPGDISPNPLAQAQWGLHLIDVGLVMGDLLHLVQTQTEAYQSRTRAIPARGPIPRTPSGKPDLNGIWQALGNAHYDLEPHVARGAMAWRPGPVVPVPAKAVLAFGAIGAVPSHRGIVVDGAIPYTPEAAERKKDNQANWVERDPEIKCYLPGLPRATYMPFPFQIFQSEKAVFMAYEYAGAVRNIYLKDPGPPQVDTWMGQSVGRWEGDTFVVEANGFNADSWLDRAGNFHSEAMKVTERYTMLGADHIQYVATIDDPQTFTRPWSLELVLYRDIDPNARLGQFKCVEFVEELLYGSLRKNPIKP